MPDQGLRSRCLEMIGSLPVPEPFGLERFRENLERGRGRPLLLTPAPAPAGCTGLWVGTREADFIFYARDTTPLHQWHIIAHEIGHMVFGHTGTRIDSDTLAALLFPDLDPAMVRAALGRSGCAGSGEREAETFASLLLEHAAFPSSPELPPGQAEPLMRAAGAFAAARPGRGE